MMIGGTYILRNTPSMESIRRRGCPTWKKCLSCSPTHMSPGLHHLFLGSYQTSQMTMICLMLEKSPRRMERRQRRPGSHLRMTSLQRRARGQKPVGKYDVGEGYLAPYKGQIYHIPEFRNGRKPVGKYEVYNHGHSSLRNVVERSFGVLKAKWRILKGVPSFNPRTQKKIIIACMSLHNYIRETKLPDEEFDKCDEDEDYIPDEDLVVPPVQGDSVPGRLDIVDMNRVRDRIANSLMSSTAS